jgi:hypothetical protein
MKTPTLQSVDSSLLLALAATVVAPCAAARKGTMTMPDLTHGDRIPAGADHDWALGASGARGGCSATN